MNRRTVLPVLNHLLACVLIALGSSFWLDRILWRAGNAQLLLTAMFVCAYLAAAVVVTHGAGATRRERFLRPLFWGLLFFGLAFAGLEFVRWQWPDSLEKLPTARFAMLFLAAGLASLLLIEGVRERLTGRLGLIVPVLLAAGSVGIIAALSTDVVRGPTRETNFIDSSLHLVQATTYRNFIKGTHVRGGAIAAFGERYLVADGDGVLHEVGESADGTTLVVRELAYRVPVNTDEFRRAAREKFGEAWTDHYHRERLRVADLVVQHRPGGTFRLFVSHHRWKVTEGCYSARVSSIEGTREALMTKGSALAWRTVYESEPCIRFNDEGGRGAWFAGYQIGGAMALIGDDALLVAIGDHEYDGWNRMPMLPQDSASPYGKILRLDIESGRSEIWSLGHRNPQGMYVDAKGVVWSTEHGPRGGDELNVVRQGGNYGWPLESYGTEYSLDYWPLGKAPGRHDEFEQPVTAFVPSIALSALTGIAGGPFDRWIGDLVLVSLSGDIRRLRIVDGRAVVVEPLHVDRRLRDIAQGQDGRLAIWTDARDVLFLESANEDSPQALKMQCNGCHTFNRREHASIGPNLWNIVGRRVAADSEFEYSEPLLDHGGRWSRERLDKFLANPAAAVPGTTMQFDGIKDPVQRQRLIDFLEELS